MEHSQYLGPGGRGASLSFLSDERILNSNFSDRGRLKLISLFIRPVLYLIGYAAAAGDAMMMMVVMVMMTVITVMTMVMIQSGGHNSGASSCSWFLARFLCSRCSSGVFCTLSETSQLHNVDTLCDR